MLIQTVPTTAFAPMKRSLTFTETVNLLGISRQTLIRWMSAGRIHAVKAKESDFWLFDPDEVERVRQERIDSLNAELQEINKSVWDYLKED